MPEWCLTAKKTMLEQRITGTALAKRLGVSRTYVSSILNGKRYSKRMVSRISDALNISDEYVPD